MAAKSKYKVGDKVQYPADDDGARPAGTGTVDAINPDVGDGCTYSVKCDRTGEVLPIAFAESELTKG